MRNIFSYITRKISTKILFSLLVLLFVSGVSILFTTVIKVSNDNTKITKNNLDMLSISIFQNLRNIMNTGDSVLMEKAESDSRLIPGVENLSVIKSQALIKLFSKNEKYTSNIDILKTFETKKKQIIEIKDEHGHFIRMIKPMFASSKCLECHTNQNIGDVIGVIDLTFSLQDADENLDNITKNITITSIIFGVITAIIIFLIVHKATQPIEGLRRGFIRLIESDESYNNLKLSVRSSDEIGEVARLFNEYIDKLSDSLVKDAKKFAHSIIDSQSNIIVSTNLETKTIQTANRSFLNFFNVTDTEEFKEKFGACICEAFEDDNSGEYVQKFMGDEYWYSYIKNRPNEVHKVLIKKENKEYIFKVTASSFNLGDVEYAVSVFTDITELEKIRKELLYLNNNLEQKVEDELVKNKKQEKLIIKQEKTAALGEMMDAIAHQWKQPLSTISAGLDGLDISIDLGEDISNEQIKATNKQTKKQIEHLITTIDEFRKFFRPNQPKSNINIKKTLEFVMKLMKDTLLDNHINIEIKGDNTIEYKLIETEFKHVFINLINNAKDAYNENSIDNRKMVFDIFKEGNELKITVADNAGGIPEEVMGTIFKANVTTKGEGKGTGIGLYLVTQIIEKLNGNIRVENISFIDENSQEQNGARFIISLPLL